MPLARLSDATTNQLHHNVHRQTVRYIARQIGAYPIAVGYLVLTITMYLDSTVDIQPIAEYRLLRHRVYTQLLVLLYNQDRKSVV